MVCNVRIMEVDMFKELLPIGSVVLLKGGIKKIMVTGIKPVSKDDDGTEQEYDYIGVIYPEGYLNDEFNFLFNHSDVNDVVFRGYENPERVEFIEYMEEVYKKGFEKEMRKQMVFNMYEEGYSVDLIADIVVELTKEEIEDAIKIRKK